MIKLGIIGLGNVGLALHFPVLLARQDISISWVSDVNLKYKKLVQNNKIKFFDNYKDALKTNSAEIILITTPYNSRSEIIENINNKVVKGIYCEKPFALTLKEHENYVKNFDEHSFTIGYHRRSLGTVQTVKKIIDGNLFGKLLSVNIQFGSLHYNFDNFRSDKHIAGGGMLFEAGSHWIDTVLYATSSTDIINFKAKKNFANDLDISSSGEFIIKNDKFNDFKCKFVFSSFENLNNKIEFTFSNAKIELFLFEDGSDLILSDNKLQKFTVSDFNFRNFPNDSLSIGTIYWEKFINSYKNKKINYTSQKNYKLTTKFIEMFYAK